MSALPIKVTLHVVNQSLPEQHLWQVVYTCVSVAGLPDTDIFLHAPHEITHVPVYQRVIRASEFASIPRPADLGGRPHAFRRTNTAVLTAPSPDILAKLQSAIRQHTQRLCDDWGTLVQQPSVTTITILSTN